MNLIKSKKFVGVYHNKLKDGDISYYIQYRDPNGKPHKTKIGKKSEYINESYCHQIRTQTINSLKNGELPPYVQIRKKHKAITLNGLADYYFDHIKNRSSHKWLNKYNKWIRNTIGDKDIDLIGFKEMDLLQRMLIDADLAPSTINDYFCIVSTICNYGLKYDIYKGKNPTKLIKKLKVDNKRERFLSKSEIADLLENVKSDPTLLLFTKLSLSTGGRIGTVLNIKKKDVDLENGIIILKDFKNDSTYNGYITDSELTDLLRIKLKSIGNNDFLIEKDGISNIKRYIEGKMKRIYEELFNYDLNPNDEDYRKFKVVNHTLRHTFCSTLGTKGVSPFTLKKLSNHSSLKMLERYTKLDPQNGKDKVNGLYD
jgi:integrase